jgi:hypothetical protein
VKPENETLKDALPEEFMQSYRDTRAYAMRNIRVVAQHCSLWEQENYPRWPGTQKNVHFWVELENGYIVGWNENPSRGWSFPVMKIPEKAQSD